MAKSDSWMLMKRKNIMNNNYSHFQDSSWEEKAFAEDAAGGLGGCIWPPRSYSCSFCHREFRSAQALGGHMNVHRRDRARLKQDQDHDSSCLSDSKTSVEDEYCNACLDLSVGLNLMIFKNGSCGDEAIINCKRPKIDASSMKLLIEPISGAMEGELDLELRLGVLPKVK